LALPISRRVGRRRRRGAGRGIRPLVTVGRFVGVLLMVAAGAAFYGLNYAAEFRLDPLHVEISGLVHTNADDARHTMGLDDGRRPNLFRLRTMDMERALAALPAVARADVSAVLPDRLVVQVTERQPVYVLRTGGHELLVDAAGVVVNDAQAVPGSAAGLPQVTDERASSGPVPQIGQAVDSVDLGAVLQLAALTPPLIGSGAAGLSLTVDGDEGFVLTAEPDSWRAVFGFYTASLRPVDIIPRQVQCLRSLLAGGEDSLRVIYLQPVGDRCGTFEARGTPSPPASR
jgi:hypothetical protein